MSSPFFKNPSSNDEGFFFVAMPRESDQKQNDQEQNLGIRKIT
ncbi:hypothetical protein SAMN05444395_110121 [Flavobacterium fryxellicola]|nr:hypothetical protein SAMN05444395_110121 [Flavobacterium fryxellicola]